VKYTDILIDRQGRFYLDNIMAWGKMHRKVFNRKARRTISSLENIMDLNEDTYIDTIMGMKGGLYIAKIIDFDKDP
jgi:hypothetical protein